DMDFNENEQLTAEFCYTANDCASTQGKIITYGATYNCFERQCFLPSQKEFAIDFAPAFSPEPVAQLQITQAGAICGQNFIGELTISSDLGGDEGLYQDLEILLPLCGGPVNLDGSQPMLDGLQLSQISIRNNDTGNFDLLSEENGGVMNNEVWEILDNGSIRINFDGLAFDVDGSGGLSDEDGDGMFDDLDGDEEIVLQIQYEFTCSSETDRAALESCGALVCTIENLEIRGLRSCGQEFQQTAPLMPETTYIYGATDVSSNAGPTANLSFGYQFEGVGAGAANGGEVGASVGTTVTHGYQFGQTQISGCANAETILEVVVTGGGNLVNDFELVAGSASYAGTAIPPSQITQTTTIPTPGDTVITIQFNAGMVPNPTASIEEFQYSIAFDECFCVPRTGNIRSRILETCPGCPDGDCIVVKSCISQDLRINTTECNCVCPVRGQIEEMYRLSTGFTDKTMTTQVQPTGVNPEDTRRLLPGDTMFVRAKYTIDDISAMRALDRLAGFRLSHLPDAEGQAGIIEENDTDLRAMPCIVNERFSSIRAAWIQRAGSLTMQPLYLPSSIDNNCMEIKAGVDPYPLQVQDPTLNIASDGVQTTYPIRANFSSRPVVVLNGREFGASQDLGVEFSNEDPSMNCLTDWFTNVNLQNGDAILFDWWLKIQPNPGQDRSLSQTTIPAFRADYVGSGQGPSTGQTFYCDAPTSYRFYNPSPVEVATDVTLTEDGCSVNVESTFTLPNSLPPVDTDDEDEGNDTPWYTTEYRPISGVAWSDITIPANLAFCGDIQILDYLGNVIGTVPASQLAFEDMTRLDYLGETYYIAEPGVTVGRIRIEDAEYTNRTPGLDVQGFAFNAANVDPVSYAAGDMTLVGGTFPLLGVGLQSDLCNFKLRYQLKRVCPDNVEASDFTSVVGSSYTTTENYLIGRLFPEGNYYAAYGEEVFQTLSRLAPPDMPDLTYISGGPSPVEWLGTDQMDFGQSLYGADIPGLEVYWPYAADLFARPGETDFASAHGGLCPFDDVVGVGTDADADGCPDNIYGVGFNPNNQLYNLPLPVFVDNSGNFPSLTVDASFNLISDTEDADDVNFVDICAGRDGANTLDNLVSTITLPPSVSLVDIRVNDVNGAPVSFTPINTTPEGGIVFEIMHEAPGETRSPGECYRFAILTELLFCPIGLDFNTTVTFTSNAGCLSTDLSARLSAASEGVCQNASTSYEYISDEADIQVEFFVPENGFGTIALCEEFCIAGRVKNVKTSSLVNIVSQFVLPNGLLFTPGSWQISYPGGPNSYDNGVSGDMVLQDCSDMEAWTDIPDPIEVAPTRRRGSTYEYNWANDLFGAVDAAFDDVISNGLPGVGGTSAVDNLNQVAFRFRVATVCDEFVSGSDIRFLATAEDPCENTVASNLALTPPVVIQDADPMDFAQLLTIADQPSLNCGEMGTLNITTVNTSFTDEVTLGARQCINIPTDGITYAPGSLVYVVPAGFDGMPTETDIFGPDGVTVVEKEICFNVPDNLGPGESYQIAFDFELTQDVTCDDGEISVEIGTVLDGIPCAGTDMVCSVAVLNSVNPTINVEFLPPLDVENFKVTSACDSDPNTIVYAYMFDLTNPGPAFMDTIEVDIVRDLNQNGILDDFELDTMSNPILGTRTMPVNLPMGASTSLVDEINVPANIGCPAFMRIRQNSDCACDENVVYIDGAIPEFFAELGTDQVLCPGSPLILDVCPDYSPAAGNDYTFTDGDGRLTVSFMGSTVLVFESDPIEGIDFGLVGNEVTATLNPGFGLDTPVDIELTVNEGFCQETFDLNVRAAPDLEIGPYEAQVVCTDEKTVLDLNLDAILEANATITWSPATFLDNPTSSRPVICNPTSDIQYTVTVELNDSEMGCTGMATYDVVVQSPGSVGLTYSGETTCYDEDNPSVLTADPGFANYEFFVLVGGEEFIVQTGTNNVYNVPGPGGTYFVRVDDGSECGLTSAPTTIPSLPCDTCPDIYNGITPVSVCVGETLDSLKV
ncbi:MAG: hypothetical protein AAF738_01930, partial [Bacteroidota bacterium]